MRLALFGRARSVVVFELVHLLAYFWKLIAEDDTSRSIACLGAVAADVVEDRDACRVEDVTVMLEMLDITSRAICRWDAVGGRERSARVKSHLKPLRLLTAQGSGHPRSR